VALGRRGVSEMNGTFSTENGARIRLLGIAGCAADASEKAGTGRHWADDRVSGVDATEPLAPATMGGIIRKRTLN